MNWSPAGFTSGAVTSSASAALVGGSAGCSVPMAEAWAWASVERSRTTSAVDRVTPPASPRFGGAGSNKAAAGSPGGHFFIRASFLATWVSAVRMAGLLQGATGENRADFLAFFPGRQASGARRWHDRTRQ